MVVGAGEEVPQNYNLKEEKAAQKANLEEDD